MNLDTLLHGLAFELKAEALESKQEIIRLKEEGNPEAAADECGVAVMLLRLSAAVERTASLIKK